MDFIVSLAESKIREAIQKGELDHLANKGKPLKLDDMTNIPEELRAAYIILRNANVLPEEVELKKEIISLQKLIDCCHETGETGEVNSLKRKLTYKILKFDIMMEKRKLNFALGGYKEKIYQKFGGY